MRAIATRIGFVDEPDERRIHTKVTPNGGGVAMFVAFLVAIIVASRIPALHGIFQGSSEPLGVVLGLHRDRGRRPDRRRPRHVRPAKMSGQVLAAMVLVFLGVTMFWFKLPFAGLIVLSSFGDPAAHRPMGDRDDERRQLHRRPRRPRCRDRRDRRRRDSGLRAAPDAVRVSSEATTSARSCAVIACGVCLGFLPHNFHPARVFMGDAGALFLGLLMAVSTMVIGGRTTDVTGQTYFFFAPLLIPLFILGVPIVDMAFAFVRRTAKGTQFHSPDKDHIHHRLLRLGHGPRRTVVILWGWTAVLSGIRARSSLLPEGQHASSLSEPPCSC